MSCSSAFAFKCPATCHTLIPFFFVQALFSLSLFHDTASVLLSCFYFLYIHLPHTQSSSLLSLSSLRVHLFPFSLSSFLSPLPLTLPLLAISCLSRGRKSLELNTPMGSHSSSGMSEMEGEGTDLLPPPSSSVARWAREAAAGQQDLLLRETQREEMPIQPQLLLLTASLCISMGMAA